MIIKFGKDTTVKDVKQQFQTGFPFLKIEFTSKPLRPGEYIRHADWFEDECRISVIAKHLEPDYIFIQPWHKTGEIEALFRNQFGLNAQIFRQEGDRWFQTAGTDVFTLTEQNETGKFLSLKKSGISRKELESLL